MNRPFFRPRSEYRHWTAVRTRWHDNDVYGHVNNVVYYSWIDTAVNGALLSMKLLTMTDSELVGLVVESGCSYHSSIAFPDAVEIGLRVERIGNSSVLYHAGIYRSGEEEAAAQGFLVHVYVSRDRRRPMRLPDYWRSALADLG